MYLKQRTVKETVKFQGVGLHSGKKVEIEIRPASANTGLVFCRSDLTGKPYFKATPDSVVDTKLATRLADKQRPEVCVSTTEHLLAAMYALGIDNAIIEVNGEEIPILDGSAVPFLVLLDEVGTEELADDRKLLVIKKAIEVTDPKDPSRFIRVEPSKQPWISYQIEFSRSKVIGSETLSCALSGEALCKELAFARTFCLLEDIERLRAVGLARGGTLENAIVVNGDSEILNQNGLRADKEFVRHKVLDCIGDLALLGMPILGHVIASKAGHDLHNALSQELMRLALAQESSVELVAKVSPKAAPLFQFPRSLHDIAISWNSATLPVG